MDNAHEAFHDTTDDCSKLGPTPFSNKVNPLGFVHLDMVKFPILISFKKLILTATEFFCKFMTNALLVQFAPVEQGLLANWHLTEKT